ncbi:MAG: polyribonucleotide nucleotidyltransferase [candidate division NC10 bacterium]|nr:polyribonucleotide nucleotidyltransferase [candidate division NC10 bacterium]
MVHTIEREFQGRRFVMEVGKVAKQADGAIWTRFADTVVLVTAVASKEPREGIDFFPLTVDYQEKAYAAGKIPGGFFKREGRPGDKETLTSRLIDRPLRPLFPKSFRNEVQVIATVLSADQENDPDVLALVGASCALCVSPIPFAGPVGAVRVARVKGNFLINPTYAQLDEADLDLVVAGTEEAVVMVEGGAKEVPEEVILEAIYRGHQGMLPLLQMQRELMARMGTKKMEVPSLDMDQSLLSRVKSLMGEKIRSLVFVADKEQQKRQREELVVELLESLSPEAEEVRSLAREAFDAIEREEMRHMILSESKRADGRRPEEVRPIRIEVGVLPRTHGSALFTRGQTQALVTTTLGTVEDQQRIDDIEEETTKRFMLHYNFPPFSVGEVRFMRGPGRREIGHGALAERSLLPVLPSQEQFPYTLRIVSDILESNGSSSMATVCGASLSLMDAGVPIRSAVAGVAMGLVKEADRFAILTDIQGLEDHLGDMDFKVAGTREGVTALQMDIKVGGVTQEILQRALQQAKEARLFVLDEMNRVISEPRESLSPYAPRIITIQVPVDKIREVIGPGGKVIRGIIDETGVKMDVSDDGTVTIASVDEAAAQKALSMVSKIVEVPEVGKVYLGKVKKIMEFGAFVEILPNTDGLLHISQIADYRVKKVEDELSLGEEVMVKVVDIDRMGKIRLSRKELLQGPSSPPVRERNLAHGRHKRN